MEIKDLQGKLVAILGYGMEGKATAAYLIKHGIKPVLFDQRPWDEWQQEEQDAIKKLGINFIFGPDCFKELGGFDVAFRSPGIRLNNINLAGRQAKGLIITSQTKWFFEHCPAKIIGVTGTKGKGTTCALIYEILREQSQISNLKSKIYLTGNIGKTQPLEILDELKPDDWIIYELSSFQLQDLEQSPHIGVVLMVTSEHLDYHKDNNEYIEAKSAIVKYQTADGFAIINADFPASMEIGSQGRGKKLYFNRKTLSLDFDGRQNQDLKTEAPDIYIKDGWVVAPNADFKLDASTLQLKGLHNLENVCAAVLAARCAGCSDEAIKSVAANFKGLEHRLEFVAEKQGIKFYNDSFSTTPETAIAAIEAFSEPLVVILGGSQKNSDFTELGKTISRSKNIKALILIGQEAAAIKNSANFNGAILEGAKNIAEIFSQIKSVDEKGDVVLLSPACASFDMFKNYKDRGEQFKQQVQQWL